MVWIRRVADKLLISKSSEMMALEEKECNPKNIYEISFHQF